MPGSATGQIPGAPFVGRERELALLQSAFVRAAAGRLELCFLTGEPGIGKTRLVEEFAATVPHTSARVHWAHCWEGGGVPAYWPWRETLRACLATADAEAVVSELGPSAADLARLIPELRRWLSAEETARDVDAGARFRLFASVAAFLKHRMQTEPATFIFDDLHWADPASLLLLQFVARECRNTRLLILGTYRDVDLDSNHPLLATLGAVARDSERLVLGGLTAAQVAAYLHATRLDSTAQVIEAVYERSGGNPFFVRELARLLVSDPEGAAHGMRSIPLGIRETIRERIGRLTPPTQRVLAVAAVIGREFGLRVVQASTPDTFAPGLPSTSADEARAAGLVERTDAARQRYRFAHALVQETLYDNLSSDDRTRIHLAVAKALEDLPLQHPDRHDAALAHHFVRAAVAGPVDRAIHYCRRAGEAAWQRLAYEEAASHFEDALKVLDLQGGAAGADLRQRADLLLAVGEMAGLLSERTRACEAFRRAAVVARGLGEPELLARAALGMAPVPDISGQVNREAIDLLEEAGRALGDSHDALRARVLARTAATLALAGAPHRATALSRQALALAERSEDPGTGAFVAQASRYALAGPDHRSERTELTRRIAAFAETLGNTELRSGALFWGLLDMLEAGDVASFDATLVQFTRLSDSLRQPFLIWRARVLRAMRLLLGGQLAAAEVMMQEALALGEQAHTPNAALVFGIQYADLCLHRGRDDDLDGAISAVAVQFSEFPALQCAVALVDARRGRLDAAGAALEHLAADGCAALPRDATWLGAMEALVHVCAAVGNTTHAPRLYEALLPHANQNIIVGFGDLCHGSVSRCLALLATTMRRWPRAEHHFVHALRMNTALGARPLAAHVRREWARMLLARRHKGDRDRARALLSAAAVDYHDLALERVADETRLLLQEAGGSLAVASSATAPADDGGPTANLFRHEDELWELCYGGRTARVRHLRGLQYISRLVAEPGREYHVADLVLAARPGGAQRGADPGRAVPDAQAKAAYRRRVHDLREQMEEAERLQDPLRAACARDEIERLTDEISARYGLGGAPQYRDRNLERARQAVSKCVRVALRRLHRAHPQLCQHLTASLRMGTFCSYRPEKPTTWLVA